MVSWFHGFMASWLQRFYDISPESRITLEGNNETMQPCNHEAMESMESIQQF